ncbi:hypothetical protein Avbf_09258, partial [Armadillidium vulgare]
THKIYQVIYVAWLLEKQDDDKEPFLIPGIFNLLLEFSIFLFALVVYPATAMHLILLNEKYKGFFNHHSQNLFGLEALEMNRNHQVMRNETFGEQIITSASMLVNEALKARSDRLISLTNTGENISELVDVLQKEFSGKTQTLHEPSEQINSLLLLTIPQLAIIHFTAFLALMWIENIKYRIRRAPPLFDMSQLNGAAVIIR